jgi:2-methylisocitrate lyase-like PEP mutase family enzyme
VAETIRLAAGTGLAGASIEDHTGDAQQPIYPADLARARIEAAAGAAHAGSDLVLTARCENYLHGRRDLADTIARLQSFQEAGADVLYAPGLADIEEIRTLVAAVDAPVNVLCLPGGPDVAALAAVGVARISVGSAFFNVAMGALVEAAREWRERGTHAFWQRALVGIAATKPAFGPT